MNPADLPRAAKAQNTTTASQVPMTAQTPSTPNHQIPMLDRSREMHLLHEALARAQMEERLREADLHRRAVHVRAARKMKRRAEVASLRARRALALAVMQ